MLIYKCASVSLRRLAETYPDRYQIINRDEMLALGFNDVTVFIRDPEDRYFSGISTQVDMYNFSISEFLKMGVIPMLDLHTVPQFLSLLKFGLNQNIYFDLKKFEDINKVIPNLPHANKRTPEFESKIFDEFKDQINYLFTEDVILQNLCGNKMHINEIIDKIKQETEFVSDMKNYIQFTNYLI